MRVYLLLLLLLLLLSEEQQQTSEVKKEEEEEEEEMIVATKRKKKKTALVFSMKLRPDAISVLELNTVLTLSQTLYGAVHCILECLR